MRTTQNKHQPWHAVSGTRVNVSAVRLLFQFPLSLNTLLGYVMLVAYLRKGNPLTRHPCLVLQAWGKCHVVNYYDVHVLFKVLQKPRGALQRLQGPPLLEPRKKLQRKVSFSLLSLNQNLLIMTWMTNQPKHVCFFLLQTHNRRSFVCCAWSFA